MFDFHLVQLHAGIILRGSPELSVSDLARQMLDRHPSWEAEEQFHGLVRTMSGMEAGCREVVDELHNIIRKGENRNLEEALQKIDEINRVVQQYHSRPPQHPVAQSTEQFNEQCNEQSSEESSETEHSVNNSVIDTSGTESYTVSEED